MTQTIINRAALIGAMKDNIEVLKKGYMTILPVLDEGGRPVLWMDKYSSTMPTVDEVSFHYMILFRQI